MYVACTEGEYTEYRGIRSEGVGKACRKRYCQLDWCFGAARRAIIRKGRTTSVHHIWQTFPNMVTSTSKYGSRGRPLVALCNTARPHSRPNIPSTDTRAIRLTDDSDDRTYAGFFDDDFGADPRPRTAVSLPRTSFSRRRRAMVGGGQRPRIAATRGGISAVGTGT